MQWAGHTCMMCWRRKEASSAAPSQSSHMPRFHNTLPSWDSLFCFHNQHLMAHFRTGFPLDNIIEYLLTSYPNTPHRQLSHHTAAQRSLDPSANCTIINTDCNTIRHGYPTRLDIHLEEQSTASWLHLIRATTLYYTFQLDEVMSL